MGLWNSLTGILRIRIISASAREILKEMNNAGITLREVAWRDELTVDASILRPAYKSLKGIVDAKGGKVELIQKSGLYWPLKSMKKRPVLLCGLLIYLALAVFLPTRIFFITVEGNETVSTETVTTQAENVGIRFGASRRDIRSERVKNALLASVPELQWAGVNTYGCVAVISVRERSAVPEMNSPTGVCSIVAKCDGIIQEVTVTRGNVLCKAGQAVKAGQVLISGYTDCGISIKATTAEGEVYAQTKHKIQAMSPSIRTYRKEETGRKTNYSLIIGKKLIKLYKDSGISDTGCVKMYKEHILTLPGGFHLPVSLLVETQVSSLNDEEAIAEELLDSVITVQSKQLTLDSMLAGTILSEAVFTHMAEEILSLQGEYNCFEMIGQIYNEEIIKGNE